MTDIEQSPREALHTEHKKKMNDLNQLIQNTFYDTISKVSLIEDSKVADTLNSMSELIVLIMEKSDLQEKWIDVNINGIVGDVSNIINLVDPNRNGTTTTQQGGDCGSGDCCGDGSCSTDGNGQKKYEVTDDIMDLAGELMGDSAMNDNGYKQYINTKRKETKEFVKKNNSEKVTDDEQLEADISELSNFIEKKLR